VTVHPLPLRGDRAPMTAARTSLATAIRQLADAVDELERRQAPYIPKVKRLPVFQSIRQSGISARILAMKLRPVQCIGITTSGASSFNSAIVIRTFRQPYSL
jgi:hypothetical protein